jgi:hypothetical protein
MKEVVISNRYNHPILLKTLDSFRNSDDIPILVTEYAD